MTELEAIKKKFLRQARTFRCLAKMLYKDPEKNLEGVICEGLAELSEHMAEIVTKEMEKDDKKD